MAGSHAGLPLRARTVFMSLRRVSCHCERSNLGIMHNAELWITRSLVDNLIFPLSSNGVLSCRKRSKNKFIKLCIRTNTPFIHRKCGEKGVVHSFWENAVDNFLRIRGSKNRFSCLSCPKRVKKGVFRWITSPNRGF